MSMNPYPKLPVDEGYAVLQEFPANIVAKARYAAENASASSVISVGANTTVLEVTTGNGTVGVRWVPRTETAAVSPFASVITAVGTTSNYDHVVAANTTRRFAIPIEAQGVTASVVGKNVLNGLYQRVAVKSFGVGSVMLSEF